MVVVLLMRVLGTAMVVGMQVGGLDNSLSACPGAKVRGLLRLGSGWWSG